MCYCDDNFRWILTAALSGMLYKLTVRKNREVHVSLPPLPHHSLMQNLTSQRKLKINHSLLSFSESASLSMRLSLLNSTI